MDSTWVVGLILPGGNTKAVTKVRSHSVDIVIKRPKNERETYALIF